MPPHLLPRSRPFRRFRRRLHSCDGPGKGALEVRQDLRSQDHLFRYVTRAHEIHQKIQRVLHFPPIHRRRAHCPTRATFANINTTTTTTLAWTITYLVLMITATGKTVVGVENNLEAGKDGRLGQLL